jgi:hypothetical protein
LAAALLMNPELELKPNTLAAKLELPPLKHHKDGSNFSDLTYVVLPYYSFLLMTFLLILSFSDMILLKLNSFSFF